MSSFKERTFRYGGSVVVFMGLVSLTAVSRGTEEGFYSSVVSTIEVRFQLKTFQFGIIQTVAGISSFTTILILGYFSDFSHKPKIIGFVGLLTAVGGLLQAMPRLLFETNFSSSIDGVYSGDNTSNLMCNIYGTKDETFNDSMCSVEDYKYSGPLWNQVWWLIVGKLIQSFGQEVTPILSLTYLDDSHCSKFVPIFLVILGASKRIGFVVGGLMASFALRVPSTWPSGSSADFKDPDDPNFLGAWWLGFVLQGVFMVLTSLPILCFPARLNNESGERDRFSSHSLGTELGATDRHKTSSISQRRDTYVMLMINKSSVDRWPSWIPDVNSNTHETDEEVLLEEEAKEDTKGNSVRGYFQSLGRVLTNPVIVSLYLAEIMFYYAAFAVGPYLTKYVEIVYRLSRVDATFVRVYAKPPSIIIGYIMSGLLMSMFKLRRRGSIVCVAICFSAVAIITPIQLLIGCENKPIAGITTTYNAGFHGNDGSYSSIRNNISSLELISSCNIDCDCAEVYNPVCGSDSTTYFSPCHAGCVATLNQTIYTECSCIDDEVMAASSGECKNEESCWLIVSIIIIIVVSSIDSFVSTPRSIVKIRFVDKRDRSMCLSVSKFLAGISKLPSHMVFGWLFDQSCLFFKSSCNETGNCLIYDVEGVRYLMFGVASVTAFISSVSAILSMFLAIGTKCRTKISLAENGHLPTAVTETIL